MDELTNHSKPSNNSKKKSQEPTNQFPTPSGSEDDEVFVATSKVTFCFFI
jgi:hypothetical protein